VIDLSHKTAILLGFHDNGLARVKVEYVGRAPLEGTDDRILMATLRQNSPAPVPSPIMVASAQGLPLPRNDRRNPILRDAPPFPVERPYTLGDEQAEQAVRVSRTTSTDMAAMPRRPQGADFDRAQRSPVSAYAPTRYDPVAAYLSGRGLY
jgi:rare lipoprotein A